MTKAKRSTGGDGRVGAVRGFNRFYTGVIGTLGEGLHETPYSLTEARVLFELAQQTTTGVADLRRTLGLDAGYLSRVLAGLETRGLVTRGRSSTDARRQTIRLTDAGGTAFATLDARAVDDTRALLDGLTDADQRRLTEAMETIRRLLGEQPSPRAYLLREPRPGELGWVVERHGALYDREYGWDPGFEALVARIVADFAGSHDPERERAWIAEVGGEPAGSIFCVRKEETVAQLRLLLVEPSARGLGIGARLVDECLDFARRAGYAEIVLWTNDVLDQARRLYERAGFELVDETPSRSFGHDLVEQIWSRRL